MSDANVAAWRAAWRASPLRHGIALGAFSLAAALILAASDTATETAIAARKAEDLLRSLAQVVPADIHTNDLSHSTYTITDPQEGAVSLYLAQADGAITGAAFELTGYGYSGAIRVLLGIDPDGTLLGVRVLAHSETPGLGDYIEARKGNWILGFEGRSLGDPAEPGWAVRKDGGEFDQFSGATLTPRAVVSTVLRGLQLFERQRAQILALGGKDGA